MARIKELKKIQRQVNTIIKSFNQNILKDELWKGRFIIRQIQRYDMRWYDGSGYISNYLFEFKDLKTGRTEKSPFYQIYHNDDFFAYNVFKKLNNFIVMTCNVWSEEPAPSIKDTTVYRER